MASVEIRFNGRKVSSSAQLQHELTRSLEGYIKDGLKQAAGPGVRIKKTRDGYICEGTEEQIKRMQRQLR